MNSTALRTRLARVNWPPPRKLAPWIGMILFVFALIVLHRTFGSYHVRDVLSYLKSIPVDRAGLALAAVAINYLVFVGYDLIGLAYAGQKLPLRDVAPVSMLSFSFSNVVGGTLVSGGGIRYRFYTVLGVSTLDIARITVVISATWWLGTLFMTGVAGLAYPDMLNRMPEFSNRSISWLSIPFLLIVLSYLVATVVRKNPTNVAGMSWTFPRLHFGLAQLAVSSADLILSATVLYLLLPGAEGLSYVQFTAVFIIGCTIALLSLVPAGIGVLEAIMVYLLAPYYAAPEVLGGMLAFRAIYYLCPLGLGALGLGGYEALQRLRPAKSATEIAAGRAVRIVPHLLGLAALMIGLLLLWTGTLPAPKAILKSGLPLGLFETSHFLSSIVGMVLIILSRGLQTKLRGAYLATLAMLAVGIGLQMIKGHAPLAVVLMGGVFLALLPCHGSFHRRSSLRNETFSSGWLLTIGIMITSTAWLLLFNYREVDYQNSLWWAFSIKGDAPRALRATTGAAVFLLGFGVWRLFRPSLPCPHPPTAQDFEDLQQIIQAAPNTHGHLALLGDKQLLFSPDRKSFLMYGVENSSWVVLGDPVGDPGQFPELIWSFREMVNRHDGNPAFYQVGEDHVPAYMDAGFSFYKLGEEAMVSLHDFTLEGSSQRDMRSVHRKLGKLGYTFDFLPRAQVPETLPRIKAISDAWMGTKNVSEKAFSIGCFDETYLSHFDFAVVRDAEQQIIAFANLFPGDGHTELSVDLIRYHPDSPNGIMDFLFTCIFIWGHEQGYQQFNLGMAPLSGLEDHPLSPLWHQIGGWVYRHGEHFYNFQGLRGYKNKFNPDWRPKYLATLGGLSLPRVLFNVNELISGNFARSLFRK